MGNTATDATERVAANVRAEMAVRRITGLQMADDLRVARSTMYRRLDGKAAWPIDAVEDVAAYLNVSVASLLLSRGNAA